MTKHRHTIHTGRVNGEPRARLTVPQDYPRAVVEWAKELVEEDIARDAAAAPAPAPTPPPTAEVTKSYLQSSRALGCTTAEAVDARVKALQFQHPTRSYRELLDRVLDADPELKDAYRDTPA